MTLKIGEKIKSLRKEQDITQEKLAAYLNISYQAISKWENGTAYPDITLVPRIANFFGVSSDELLGINKDEHTAELKVYEEKRCKLNQLGKVMPIIELCREVLKKYPRNYEWMLNLASALISYNHTEEQVNYSKEHNFIEEAITLCERIREDCTIDHIRHGATQILCYKYPELGKKELAIELACQMPEMVICKELLLEHIYDGEEKVKQSQGNMLLMIDQCALTLTCMTTGVSEKSLTLDEKIQYIKASNTLYQTIFLKDEDSLFYNCRLSLNYRRLANFYCQKKDSEEALKYLLLAEKCASNFDRAYTEEEQHYKSIFVNHCTHNPKQCGKNYESTERQILLESMQNPVFDLVRETEEFKSIHLSRF